ncbi:MAG: hypothetical protein IJI87_02360 [Mogibacterium sp.]|nr:hypothetical protein [Mogibacterium sp.]
MKNLKALENAISENQAISYEYPMILFDYDDPDDSKVIYHQARLNPIQFDHEPYEAALTARGYYYHLIFGSQTNGGFLCVPNWFVGCEIADLDDVSWNMDSLLDCDARVLEYEDASAIAWALKSVSDLVN